MSIGVPIKVLHEAEGHIVTCETNSGEVYRGKLVEAEDNMNCQVTTHHFFRNLNLLGECLLNLFQASGAHECIGKL